jgi:hypothetical protein
MSLLAPQEMVPIPLLYMILTIRNAQHADSSVMKRKCEHWADNEVFFALDKTLLNFLNIYLINPSYYTKVKQQATTTRKQPPGKPVPSLTGYLLIRA